MDGDYIAQMITLAKNGEAQGILFFAAVYAFAMCMYSAYYQIRVSGWPGVVGELIRTDVEAFGASDWVVSDRDYVADALYHYRVDSRDYQGKRVSPWVFVASHNARFVLNAQLKAINHLPDNKVMVHYNPANPHKSFLLVPGLASQLLTVLLGCVPCALYFLKYA